MTAVFMARTPFDKIYSGFPKKSTKILVTNRKSVQNRLKNWTNYNNIEYEDGKYHVITEEDIIGKIIPQR